MAWKLAGTLFRGGTLEVRALLGKRVRARRLLSGCRLFDPSGREHETTDIVMAAEGLIGYVPTGQLDQILLVFPIERGVRLLSLDQAARQRIQSVLINWPTFRDAFDIDV